MTHGVSLTKVAADDLLILSAVLTAIALVRASLAGLGAYSDSAFVA